MKNIAIILVGFVVLSCNQSTPISMDALHQNESVNVDSLIQLFLVGWNNQDSAAILNTIADSAIVMNDSLVHMGKNNIAKNWISGGVKVISNVRTNSLIKSSGNSIAFNGGTYSLDLTPPGGPLLKEKGNYSLIWSKQKSGEWKLAHIHIEDVTRMPDIQ